MSWARIDDAFDDHPKVLAVLEHEQGAAAIGLWTLCLTWAHRNTRKRGKVPGLLPASLPRRYLGPGARELAALLVKERLWEDRAGEGWVIHDFERYLPTEQTRDARAEAGKRGAEARWGKRAGRDSKLPSEDGKPMAADSNSGSPGQRNDDEDPDTLWQPLPDGKEPSFDSNLPSGLPSSDGKPMASDGSRAPARRAIPNGIAPTPAPGVPPTAGTAKPRRRLSADEVAERTRHVGEVVAAFVEGATDAGLKSPPPGLRSRVGKQARELLAEDWEIDFLIDSARRMGASEYSDLGTQVRKDDAAAHGVGSSQKHAIPTTDQRVAQAQAVKAKLRTRYQENP
jgi:hypothetical protein